MIERGNMNDGPLARLLGFVGIRIFVNGIADQNDLRVRARQVPGKRGHDLAVDAGGFIDRDQNMRRVEAHGVFRDIRRDSDHKVLIGEHDLRFEHFYFLFAKELCFTGLAANLAPQVPLHLDPGTRGRQDDRVGILEEVPVADRCQRRRFAGAIAGANQYLSRAGRTIFGRDG